ncbi:MAG: glycosyltransferase [Clostridiales bacterium]|jgi:glycosyltransferase involved in cell wall biosynthesis|nr:glycosyltransferase [Clostridiales bacterium]
MSIICLSKPDNVKPDNAVVKSTELVSVITPMYNAELYISDTIKSVLSQSYENWEMIIVDDCSTDNSLRIVLDFADKDDRIHIVRKRKRAGVAETRNTALDIAKGRYIALLDADDCWLPNKLERQLEFMSGTGCALSFSSFGYIDKNGNKLNRLSKAEKHVTYARLLNSNPIGCLTVIVDKRRFKNIHMPEIPHEDYACWLELLKQGHTALGLDETLALHRIYPTSVSSSKIKSLSWVWNIYRRHLNFSYIRCLVRIVVYCFFNIYKYISLYI